MAEGPDDQEMIQSNDPTAKFDTTVPVPKLEVVAPPRGELMFGFVSAVGTQLERAEAGLRNTLGARSYSLNKVDLKDMMVAFSLKTAVPAPGVSEFERIGTLMTRGNEAREAAASNSVLAGLAIGQVNSFRVKTSSERNAMLFRQLKHPEEAYLFRQVYDEGFHLVGCHCARPRRKLVLENRGMSSGEAEKLMERDEHEEGNEWGQRVRKTFPLADVFVRVTGDLEIDRNAIDAQLERYLDLLFGDKLHTPTRDEYGMYLAAAGSLRSGQLARQVGACILSKAGDVLAVGTNEVPAAEGGSYWEGDQDDSRDHRRDQDPTDQMRDTMINEILEGIFGERWQNYSPEKRKRIYTSARKQLEPTRVMNLTEFTRATHAEMDAILSAGRIGVSVVGATLYTTTFPCHNCMKHIIAAGIARVVYIEPYPKSMAYELHSDAIDIDPAPATSEECSNRAKRTPVRVEPFVGVSPRCYNELFTMTTRQGKPLRRKDADGVPTFSQDGLRLTMPTDWYMIRESNVAKEFSDKNLPPERP
jgi:deoxycytidylate deaminase